MGVGSHTAVGRRDPSFYLDQNPYRPCLEALVQPPPLDAKAEPGKLSSECVEIPAILAEGRKESPSPSAFRATLPSMISSKSDPKLMRVQSEVASILQGQGDAANFKVGDGQGNRGVGVLPIPALQQNLDKMPQRCLRVGPWQTYEFFLNQVAFLALHAPSSFFAIRRTGGGAGLSLFEEYEKGAKSGLAGV